MNIKKWALANKRVIGEPKQISSNKKGKLMKFEIRHLDNSIAIHTFTEKRHQKQAVKFYNYLFENGQIKGWGIIV